jgi:hypothetical protein
MGTSRAGVPAAWLIGGPKRGRGTETGTQLGGTRTRLTIRRIMIGVALLGVVLGFVRLVFLDNSPDQLLASLLLGESTVAHGGEPVVAALPGWSTRL